MKRIRFSAPIFLVIAMCPLLMAITITIDTPATGSGTEWDCTNIDGSTTDAANGSTVTGGLYKFVSGAWSQPGGLGPFGLTTADDPDGDWDTAPTGTQIFTSKGNYKVEANVMDNLTFESATDTNTYTVSSS